ncbi:MAG: caspase family protein [Planctomycetota bacterium]
MFRRAFMTSSVALAASGVLFSESRGQGAAVRKLAFLVGVSNYYKDGFEDLSYCERDVDELAVELRKHGFTVATLTGKAATKAKLDAWLKEAFDSMSKLSK